MVSSPPSPFRLALISMPWPLFNRPSIQLGTLKAYLREHPWLQVETFHPFLSVAQRLGTSRYHWISQNVWVCEALYTSLLFPEQREQAHRIIDKALRSAPRDIRFDIDQTETLLSDELFRWRDHEQWQRFNLIGFSVCFNQLAPSLTGAKAIKEIAANTPIVFGGSSCAPRVARSLLSTFQEIDYAIIGEGEKPLLDLCRHLAENAPIPPQALTAGNAINLPLAGSNQYSQIQSLDTLPVPDYDDYFRDIQHLFAAEPFIPELPMEFSRGCWWGKCAFCNL
ncbi:MAG: hypothetical protein OEL66_10610, partial [Desulfobulbaceae bacterium]|nr:hypothetical protein [Desulfobulbaceae bacterium]